MSESSRTADAAVASPCVNVCQMNSATGLCEGCSRTLDEIAGWLDFSEARKREILTRIRIREQSSISATIRLFT